MSATPRYIKNEHGDYVCPSCDKTCAKQNTMFYHIESVHGTTPLYPCALCDQGFVQKSSWLRHLANRHPETPHPTGEVNPFATLSFACPSCDRELKTKQQLFVHYVRTHCKDVPVFDKEEGCKGCGVQHNSSGAYLYHVPKCYKIAIGGEPILPSSGL